MQEHDPGAADAADNPPDWNVQVYQCLHDLARRHLAGERADHTLNTTALVHEAWLALSGAPVTCDATRFYPFAATTMRHILIDHARRRLAQKRGGGETHIDLDVVEVPIDDAAGELLSLDRALDRLADLEPRLSQVVELRFFAGLSVEQTAQVLEIVPRSVVRDWARARAFLREVMG